MSSKNIILGSFKRTDLPPYVSPISRLREISCFSVSSLNNEIGKFTLQFLLSGR